MSDTDRLLNDVRAYLRISAAAASRATAKTVLDSYEKALVFSKLDGKVSQIKIGTDTGVPSTTISDWAAIFVQAGLVAPPDQFNSYHKALFTLQELGIELGALKKRTRASKPVPQASTTPSEPSPDASRQELVQETLEPEKSGT